MTVLDLTFVNASSAWAAGSTSVAVAYPASIAEGDRLYAVIVSKSATGCSLANWSQVATGTGATGTTPGNGNGPFRIYVMARTVPAGGLSGSATFSLTSGNSTLGCMYAWRPQVATGVTWTEAYSGYDGGTSGSTNNSGTTSGTIAGAAKDVYIAIVGLADDQGGAGGQDIYSISETGITFGSFTYDIPSGITGTGYDLGAHAWYGPVESGSATNTVTVGASSTTSETYGAVVMRLRADGTVVNNWEPTVNPNLMSMTETRTWDRAYQRAFNSGLTESTKYDTEHVIGPELGSITDTELSVSKYTSYTQSFSDTAALTDSLVVDYGHGQVDSVTATSTVTFDISLSFTDNSSMTDSSDRVFDRVLAFMDTCGLTDTHSHDTEMSFITDIGLSYVIPNIEHEQEGTNWSRDPPADSMTLTDSCNAEKIVSNWSYTCNVKVGV